MATMKRRVIYLSDEEWERLKTRATELGLTISAYLRTVAKIAGTESGVSYEVRTKPTEARYDMRPIRPVPKHR